MIGSKKFGEIKSRKTGMDLDRLRVLDFEAYYVFKFLRVLSSAKARRCRVPIEIFEHVLKATMTESIWDEKGYRIFNLSDAWLTLRIREERPL